MIRPTLSERYKIQEDSDFIVYKIPLVDGKNKNYGLVSYVRMGNPNNDVLNKLILKSIQEHYPSSTLNSTPYKTKQTSIDEFVAYDKVARIFIGVKNYAKYDPLFPAEYITNELAVFLDIYNPIEGLMYDEINYFSAEDQQTFANACDEEHHNLATYNSFVQ